jgi:transcriptional regulator with XRE-family HTH domain
MFRGGSVNGAWKQKGGNNMADRRNRTAPPPVPYLKEWFALSGLSLKELGTRMGYDPPAQGAYKFFKGGNPTAERLRSFAAAIGAQAAKVFDGRPEKTFKKN